MPEIITKGFWALLLIVTAVNAVIFNVRAKSDIAAHPDKAASYPGLIRGYLFWMSAPWVMMGLIVLRGGAESVFDFLKPTTAGWAVAVWHALVVVIWVAAACWVYGWGGAETLAAHRAFHQRAARSAIAFKLWTAAALVAGGVAELVMWCGGMQFSPLG